MEKSKNGLLIPIIAGAVLLCAAIVLLCFILIPGDKGAEDKGAEISGSGIYSVEVTTSGNKALEGIGVYVYSDEAMKDLVWFEKTDGDGRVSFEAENAEGYVIILKDVPEGYIAKESYTVVGELTSVVLETEIVEGGDISEISYKVGDVIKDFTVTDTENKEYRISEVLKNKKAVVLLFWNMESQACKDELPFVQEAYKEYEKDVAVLALHPFIIDNEAMAVLGDELGITFPLAPCDGEWINALAIDAFPTTVVIDQYGVISLVQRGSLPGAEAYSDIFAYFADEDYEQSVVEDVDKITNTELQLGSSAKPVDIGGVEYFDVTVKPGQVVYYNIYKITDQFIIINDPDACLVFNEKTYTATGGSVSLSMASSDPMAAVFIGIGNAGTEEKTFRAHIVMPQGTYGNPYKLNMGEFSASVQQGNSQGVYYRYTASADGYLTLDCLSATPGITYDYSLYNLSSYAMMNMASDNKGSSNPSVSVKVRAGDRVLITIGTISKDSELFPAGEFRFNAYFKGQQFTDDKVETEKKLAYAVVITDGARKPLSGVRVNLKGANGEAQTLTTDANGVAGAWLPAGSYTAVLAVPQGYRATTTEFVLTEKTPVISAKVEKKVTVMETYTVKVVDDKGNPVKDVMVAVGDRFAFTDASGAVKLNMEKGSYTVVVAAPEGYTCDGSYTFAKGSNSLTVSLRKGGAVDPDDPNKQSYTVTVTDYNGNAMKNVAVKFMQNSKLCAMSTTNTSGKATASLNKGSYDIELAFAEGKYYYNAQKAKVTQSAPTVTVLVAKGQGSEIESLYVGDAGVLNVGGTYVETQSNIVNYFVFEPTRSGVYKFTTSDPKAVISYWGSNSSYIADITQSTDYKNNVFTLNIKDGNIGSTYILGVTGAKGCIIEITRISDPILDDTDVPWEIYKPKKAPTAYKLTIPSGKTLKYFDITGKTSDYKIVYNSADGYYHYNTANGPIVLVDLSEDAPFFPVKDALETASIKAYIYDNNGKLVAKEDYTECMGAYVSCSDKTHGVYPLTDDIIYILKQRGAYAGWWDPNGTDYLFGAVSGVNTEIAWMFLLCYVG